MSTNSNFARSGIKLENATRRWWFYLILLAPIFIRPYASRAYDARQTMEVIMQALSSPLIYTYPILFPITKAVPAVLILGLLVLGNKLRRVFNVYVALLFLGIAVFQNASLTETYGWVVTTGNLILTLIVGLIWYWEVFAQRSDFAQPRWSLLKGCLLLLAAVALLAPVDSMTLSPDFSLNRLLTSESGLTNCMMLPVVLAVLLLYYPKVNLPLLCIMSFVGIYFGLINVVIWLFVLPSGWWMGVLHMPLLIISLCGFVLGLSRPEAAQTRDINLIDRRPV